MCCLATHLIRWIGFLRVKYQTIKPRGLYRDARSTGVFFSYCMLTKQRSAEFVKRYNVLVCTCFAIGRTQYSAYIGLVFFFVAKNIANIMPVHVTRAHGYVSTTACSPSSGDYRSRAKNRVSFQLFTEQTHNVLTAKRRCIRPFVRPCQLRLRHRSNINWLRILIDCPIHAGVGQQHSAAASGLRQCTAVHRLPGLLGAEYCAQRWQRRVWRGCPVHGAWNSGDSHAPGGPVDAVLPELRPVLRDRCAAALRCDCEHETGEILCVVFSVVLYCI